MRLFLKTAREEFGREIRLRIFQALIMMTIFTVLGSLIPYLYYRYADDRQYIGYLDVNYNKKEYTKCEEMVTDVIWKSEINTEITKALIRLERVDVDRNSEADMMIVRKSTPVWTFEADLPDAFSNKTKQTGDVFTLPGKLPCDAKNKRGEPIDLRPGIYRYSGQYSYLDPKGNIKRYDFVTPLFTIIEEGQVNS